MRSSPPLRLIQSLLAVPWRLRSEPVPPITRLKADTSAAVEPDWLLNWNVPAWVTPLKVRARSLERALLSRTRIAKGSLPPD